MYGWIVKLVFRLIATLFTLLAYAWGVVAFYGPSFLIAYFIGWGHPSGTLLIFALAAPFVVLIWLAILEHSDIPPPPKFRLAYKWLSFPAKFFIKIAYRLDR